MLIKEKEKISKYYEALINRDKAFVGIFFVAVKTTSIFCISTCRARKPKQENVLFYSSFKEALDNGFRPCKICKPTENANETPDQVLRAINLVKEHPKEKIADWKLKEENIQPEFVRRWFNKNYGITFHAFQRMYRVNTAFEELKLGKKATHSAIDSGYDSLSGFGYTYKKVIGKSPKKSVNDSLILINRLTTPIGPMFVCATDHGICLLEFVDRKMLETEFSDLQKKLNSKIIIGENKHIKQCKKELEEYFNKTRKTFDVPLDTPGTEFQNIVWKALIKIPYGETATYQQQSEHINNPSAIRAVAGANGMNRISIILPCHRVIGKDGSLTGYGGGLHRKEWLLKHEGALKSEQLKISI